jgi:nucleoside-diphosphate-sugar epimerase
MAYTYLITGGAGFIGSHLAVYLCQAGDRVRILDNFSGAPREKLELLLLDNQLDIEVVEGDLRDRDACRLAADGVDFVLHHAAMASVPRSIAMPDECFAINLVGTTNILMEAVATKTVRRFVFASSSAVYGDLPGHHKLENGELDPLSPYATSKLAGEYLCRNYSSIHGLETVSLRYFNVFGPRQDPNGPYAAVIPKFMEAISEGRSPVIYGDGEQSRDFVSVHDVVQANMKACRALPGAAVGEAFNIGSGRQTSLNQLVDILSHIEGREIAPLYLPARVGDIRHSLADVTKARERLSFIPETTLEQGLRSLAL